MKITEHIKEYAFGIETTYYLIEAEVKTSWYLIFLHGLGEQGPLDGTELPETLKHGYPEHAKNGFKFPFNIIVPQSSGDHRNLVKDLPAYIKLKYNASVIGVTGLSMGGYGTYDAKLTDKLGIINFIAPICGAGRGTLLNDYPKMRAWHFHGENDSTVRWSTARAFIDGYNKLHPDSPIKVTLYPGVGHNSWDKAYSVKPGEDELLQWIINEFKTAPQQDTAQLEEIKRSVQIFLQYLENAKNTLDQAAFHLQESINK